MIFGDVDGIEIVTIYCHTRCYNILCNTIILQHAFHPDKLRTTTADGNTFYLCCRQRYAIMFFFKPLNQVVPKKKKTPARVTLSIIGVAGPVSITVSHQGCSGVIGYHTLNSVVLLTYLIIFFIEIR